MSQAGIYTRENALLFNLTAEVNINLEMNTIILKTCPSSHTYVVHIPTHKFLQKRENYQDYIEMYTDWSKSDKRIGTAMTCQDTEIILRLFQVYN